MLNKKNNFGIHNDEEKITNYGEISIVFDQLLKPIYDKVKEESDRQPSRIREKLTFEGFFKILAYYFISEIPSMALLVKTYIKNGLLPSTLKLPIVSYSTIKDAFLRFSFELFKNVFIHLLSTISLQSIPELSALGTLYCIDGSLFPTLISMTLAEYKEKRKAIRMHLCFELNRMIPVNIMVGTGKSSERAALREMLVAEVTFIADRGYQCFKLFYDILMAKAHMVIRVKANLVYKIKESNFVQLPEGVRDLFKDVTDQLIICKNDPYKYIYRLICFRVWNESYYILTDRKDLTTFQVMMLYAYRWQIELLFRFLKRTMNGIHLINNSKNGVNIQFYMLLIVALLELQFKQKVIIQKKQMEEANPEIKPERTNNEINKQFDIEEPMGKTNIPIDIKISTPYQFFKTIGGKLKEFWKIGIHWLSKLRSLLSEPFSRRVIEILGEG